MKHWLVSLACLVVGFSAGVVSTTLTAPAPGGDNPSDPLSMHEARNATGNSAVTSPASQATPRQEPVAGPAETTVETEFSSLTRAEREFAIQEEDVKQLARTGRYAEAMQAAAGTRGDNTIYSRLIAAAAQEFALRDPRAAIDWAASPAFGDAAIQNDVVTMIFDTLARTDPASATRWLEMLKASHAPHLYEMSATAVARRWVEIDPVAAMQWTTQLENKEPLLAAVEVYSTNDPAAALSGAPGFLYSLPKELGRDLLERLTEKAVARVGAP